MALSSNSDAESQLLEIDLTQYTRLRTILDSLELGTINRYMKTPAEFAELEMRLLELSNWLWRKETIALDGNGTIECPPGYIDCRGVCVPYPCP